MLSARARRTLLDKLKRSTVSKKWPVCTVSATTWSVLYVCVHVFFLILETEIVQQCHCYNGRNSARLESKPRSKVLDLRKLILKLSECKTNFFIVFHWYYAVVLYLWIELFCSTSDKLNTKFNCTIITERVRKFRSKRRIDSTLQYKVHHRQWFWNVHQIETTNNFCF